MNNVYNEVYVSLTAYSRLVDYEEEPMRLERYSSTDQSRIRQQMAAVKGRQRSGLSLEA